MDTKYICMVNAQGAGIGIVLKSTIGLMLEESARLGIEVSNNEAEYEAFIYGLELACHLSIKKLKVRGYSVVVICQMNGVYVGKEPRLKKYFDKASTIVKYFEKIEIQVP